MVLCIQCTLVNYGNKKQEIVTRLKNFFFFKDLSSLCCKMAESQLINRNQ